jgi:FlaA1/EpsC-like NDP-sugar epimerase
MGLRRNIYRVLDAQPRWRRQALVVASDVCAVSLSLVVAYLLRFGSLADLARVEWWLVFGVALGSIPLFYLVGLYRSIIRYIGPQAITAAVKGVTLSAILLVVLALLGNERELPRSIPFIFWLVAFIGIGAPRFIARSFIHSVTQRRKKGRQAVVIYGAGAAGVQLSSALQHGGEYETVAFVDDSLDLQGAMVRGINVYSPHELPRLIERRGVSQVLLAMPSVSQERRREIMLELGDLPVRVKTLPTLGDLVSGKSKLEELRDVRIEDILGREPVPPRQDLLERNIKDKVVLVTGAGGSIGSELCRQIARLGPSLLVCLDNSELAVYQLRQALDRLRREELPDLEYLPLLGSVHDAAKLTALMQGHGVQTVYHAAAYKHVPLLEFNVAAGVRNNLLGTKTCAEVAARSGVELFVLISTDKAVRPTNVMGASKRMAELFLQSLQASGSRTRFVMVRFGNVLGSSGSVVPLFREQILAGGPVTVTHPEITRYFMTLAEAGELVIQAVSMGRGGEVFLLDMGNPVRIDDLARRMIHLMGYDVRNEQNPGGDIEIVYTGLRPGEKLFEELLIGGDTRETEHPRILSSLEEPPSAAKIAASVAEVERAIETGDLDALRQALREGVPGYLPRSRAETDLLTWTLQKDAAARSAS